MKLTTLKQMFIPIIAFILFLIKKSSCELESSSSDLDSYSAVTADPLTSQKLLDVVAYQAIPAYGGKRFVDFGEGLVTKQVIEKINSYTPQNVEVAERYAANMVAIAKLREEIYLDAKEYHESVKEQLKHIPESEKLKESLKASKEKMELSEKNYLESKKASERALEIYVNFVRPENENVLIKAEATEGKGLKIAHNELSSLEKISLPDMDMSGYEPLDADSSLMSIAESLVYPDESKESKEVMINKALDRISASIDEDFLLNNKEEVKNESNEKNDKKKLVVEEKMDEETIQKYTKDISANKSESVTVFANSDDLFGSTILHSKLDSVNDDYDDEDMEMNESNNTNKNIDEDYNKKQNVTDTDDHNNSKNSNLNEMVIPYSISGSFPSALDSLNKNKIVIIPTGTSLTDQVPEYLQYSFRRNYLHIYIAILFVESFILPQFFTENPVIKLSSVFRISKILTSHTLFGLATKYRFIFSELKRLPYVYKYSNLKQQMEEITLKLMINTLLLQQALGDSNENYKNVVDLLVNLTFNVREVLSNFSHSIRNKHPDVDYSFLMEESPYSAPKVLLPELSVKDEKELESFDAELKKKLSEVDLKKLMNELKESQLWIKEYVLKNAVHKYRQFENNQIVNPFIDFKQFNLKLTREVEETFKKLNFK